MQSPSESVNSQQDEGFPVQNAQKKVPDKKAAVPAAQQPLKSYFSYHLHRNAGRGLPSLRHW